MWGVFLVCLSISLVDSHFDTAEYSNEAVVYTTYGFAVIHTELCMFSSNTDTPVAVRLKYVSWKSPAAALSPQFINHLGSSRAFPIHEFPVNLPSADLFHALATFSVDMLFRRWHLCRLIRWSFQTILNIALEAWLIIVPSYICALFSCEMEFQSFRYMSNIVHNRNDISWSRIRCRLWYVWSNTCLFGHLL